MTTYSAAYTPKRLIGVRGGAFSFRIQARNSDDTLRDMTGETVRVRFTGNGTTIDKEITSFADVTEGATTEASGIDVTLTEAEMRLVKFPMDWEADTLSTKVVFAGDTLTATLSFTGGAAEAIQNALAPGATYVVTASLEAGSASTEANASASGAVLSLTASFIPGSASIPGAVSILVTIDARFPAPIVFDAILTGPVTVDARFPAEIVFDAAFPAPIVLDARFPAPIILDAVIPS